MGNSPRTQVNISVKHTAMHGHHCSGSRVVWITYTHKCMVPMALRRALLYGPCPHRSRIAGTAFQLTVVQFSRVETQFLCRVPKYRSNVLANVPMKGEYSTIEDASTASCWAV